MLEPWLIAVITVVTVLAAGGLGYLIYWLVTRNAAEDAKSGGGTNPTPTPGPAPPPGPGDCAISLTATTQRQKLLSLNVGGGVVGTSDGSLIVTGFQKTSSSTLRAFVLNSDGQYEAADTFTGQGPGASFETYGAAMNNEHLIVSSFSPGYLYVFDVVDGEFPFRNERRAGTGLLDPRSVASRGDVSLDSVAVNTFYIVDNSRVLRQLSTTSDSMVIDKSTSGAIPVSQDNYYSIGNDADSVFVSPNGPSPNVYVYSKTDLSLVQTISFPTIANITAGSAWNSFLFTNNGWFISGNNASVSGTSNAGTVLFFRNVGGTWTYDRHVTQQDGSATSSYFGYGMQVYESEGTASLYVNQNNQSGGNAEFAMYSFETDNGAFSFKKKQAIGSTTPGNTTAFSSPFLTGTAAVSLPLLFFTGYTGDSMMVYESQCLV